jgi:hypothetical protein
MNQLSAQQTQVLVEGLDDYVGLWRLASEARDSTPDASHGTLRRAIIDLIRPLLLNGLIEAGHLAGDGGFVPWSRQGLDALNQIERSWRSLKRDPTIGYGDDPGLPDDCWFKNTAAGDAYARRVAR